MQLDLGKNICESLLKDGLISHNTAQNRDKMELAIDDLLACFPAYLDGNQRSRNCLKKKIGRILSIKARLLNVSEDNLIKVKVIVYNKINKLNVNHPKKQQRRIKIGKKREIYSSEEQQQALKIQQNEIEETGSANNQQKSNKVTRKRKYKTFDHEFKQQVCQTALQSGIQYACKHFNLSSRKVTGWLESHNLNQLGKGRKALDPAMEFNMSVWIMKKIWEQVPLTQKIIRQKAATMNTLKIPFNGSKGWLQKFFLRHVELKSCFDTRGKLQTRQQCARYHKSAFDRLLKDYECLKKMQIGCKSLVRGNLTQIIYQNGSDPALKLRLDKNIDKFRVEENVFYDYDKFKLIQGLSNKNLAKIQEQISEEALQKQQEDQELEQQDEQEEFESSEEEQQEVKLEDQKICKNEESQYDQRHLDIYEEDEESEEEKVKIQQRAL